MSMMLSHSSGTIGRDIVCSITATMALFPVTEPNMGILSSPRHLAIARTSQIKMKCVLVEPVINTLAHLHRMGAAA